MSIMSDKKNIEIPEDNTISIQHYKKAAYIASIRQQRFIDGLSIYDELITLLKRFFSNKEKIENTGLRYVYKNLKTYVDEYGIIGYIILGTKLGEKKSSDKDVELGEYTTQLGITIKLWANEICRILIEDYYTKEELIESCKKSHNFHIYFKPCVDGII